MADNVEVLPVAHRSYDEDRDWLTPNEGRPYSNVVSFSPKLLHCTICNQRSHRASQCKQRPRSGRPAATCAND